MKQLTVRGIDSTLHHRLKTEASQRGLSVNRYVLSLLRHALGLESGNGKEAPRSYHDLDHLAGTWTEQDCEEFEQQLATQRGIDEDLWR
ncbi:MAG: hypothetical protein U9R25_09300 [Chloroflexota bacterium]|nr:hypothetical protein [Chloroflexota bacterium]